MFMMSESKRTQDEIQHLNHKIRRLEALAGTASSMTGENMDRASGNTARTDLDSGIPSNLAIGNDSEAPIAEPQTKLGQMGAHNSKIKQPENRMTLDRNEALLQALGDDLSLSGDSIHSSLAQKWVVILRKGLPDADKQKLLREYAAPENCKLLKAPSLNEEVSNNVEHHCRRRDEVIENKQNQLGLGITAISRGMSLILNKGENYEVNAMRHFNHGCRLLLDLHYRDTHTRKQLFKNDLNRSNVFKNLSILDFPRDETLFGNRVTKLVKKQGIPKTPPHGGPSWSPYGDGEPPRYRRY